MSQEKTVQFNMFTTTIGNDITITYYYEDVAVLTISAFIAEEGLLSNGVLIVQGSGAIITEGTSTFYSINTSGELIVTESESGEYEIDESGILTYTYIT